MSKKVVYANDLVWVLDPNDAMVGPIKNKGTIIAQTSPGCWGPMITPDYPSSHEVTRPIAVDGAEIGDAVALKIKKINILSKATVSGVHEVVKNYNLGDPAIAARCPICNIVNPPTKIEGTGKNCVRCQKCGNPVTPFKLTSGYTMVFDHQNNIAITLNNKASKRIAENAKEFAALPPESKQHPINLWAKGDLPGIIARMRPTIGNIGSCPAVRIPSSRNAGDIGISLINAKHEYGLTPEDFLKITDGHMDADEVREGAILIVPVKVPKAGIYVGDVHAMQGDGEIAGHTSDVSAQVVLEVEVIKNLKLTGPLILPNKEDLPFLAQPYDTHLLSNARKLARHYRTELEEKAFPLQIIGSGISINAAIDNGLQRMSELLDMSLNEIKNRATITGSIIISRVPGIIQVTMMVPHLKLKNMGIMHLCEELYG